MFTWIYLIVLEIQETNSLIWITFYYINSCIILYFINTKYTYIGYFWTYVMVK